MKVLKAGTKDAVAVAVSVFVFAGVIVCNVMFGAIAR